MEQISNYTDFMSLISDGRFNGYLVCFTDASFHSDDWTSQQFLEYLDNIEQHKDETGVVVRYDASKNQFNRIKDVVIEIYHPAYKDCIEKTDYMKWVVQYKN